MKLENTDHPNSSNCPADNLSAYIDGELTSAEEVIIEDHIKVCSDCAVELQQQKLFLLALNSSLDSENEFHLPDNFTKSIVTHAESRVSGLRLSNERSTAFFICAGLFSVILLIFGSEVFIGLGIAGKLFEKLLILGSNILHFAYSTVFGLMVIIRSLASKFVSLPTHPLVVVAIFLVGAVFVALFLSRSSFRRPTQENQG